MQHLLLNRQKLTKEIWDWREICHYMPLKGECFESIYFGVNIDEQEKEKIIQFVREKLNPHINLYQMRVYADAFRIQPEFIKPLNSDLSVYKKRRGKIPSLTLNHVSDIQILQCKCIIGIKTVHYTL